MSKPAIFYRLMPLLAAILLHLFTGFAWAQDSTEPPQDGAAQIADTTPAAQRSLADGVQHEARKFADRHPVLRWIYVVLFGWHITIQGNDVNIAKILLAIIIFLIGLRIARRLGDLAEKRLFKRFGIHHDFSKFLERLLRIAILIVVGFTALDVAGIPITVFAFLGGAIAIAIGFGAQEIIGNFIGGLILMFEKPIRVGDLIEFDGERGSVEEIGPRCTRLMLSGNVDLLVPNKQLLENKLTNWTLTNAQVRTDVLVGVVYGSPTRVVRDILDTAVRTNPGVDKTPEPIVLFEDFGDNALMFRVYFWVTVTTFMDQRRIQSEIRFAVDDACREKNIVIAFPQRDVHLDTMQPLEIKLIEDRFDRRSGAVGGRDH